MRAKKPKRLPSVLTREEVHRVLGHLSGTHLLMAKLLNDSGLRLMECPRLRVKDRDFDQCQILVRDGKGKLDTTFRSQPAQIERLKFVPSVAQRGVPLVPANAPEVG